MLWIMQITVTMPDEFAAEVQSRGISPENFVQRLIEDAARIPDAPQKADLEKFFRAMTAHSEKVPVLPEEAFTRESFYQDHD